MQRPRTFARFLVAAQLVCVLAVVASCGGSSDSTGVSPSPSPTPTPTPTPQPSTSSSITVADNSFSPSATTVPVGTTVTWTWSGSAQHNVTFSDGTKSSTQTSGSYSRTFSAAGTYSYDCTIHGQAMSGTVTVK